jgi:glycosyltransferase involved in cell wall biosynthesis
MKILLIDFKHDGNGVFYDNAKEMIDIFSEIGDVTYLTKTPKIIKDVDRDDISIFVLQSIKEKIEFIKSNIKEYDKAIFLTQSIFDFLFFPCFLSGIYLWHNPKQHPKSFSIKRFIGKMSFYIYDFFMLLFSEKVILASKNLEIPYFLNFFRKKFFYIPLPTLNKSYPNSKKYNNLKKKYEILFFGTIVKYKGLDYLISELELVSEKMNVAIIGKGSIKKEFPGLLEKIKNSRHNIDFINRYISNKELASFISSSKVVTFPYKFANGTQTIQLCYKYHVPVITSKKGALKDYVKDKITGIKIDLDKGEFKKALNDILNNYDSYTKKLIKSDYTKKFEKAEIVKNYKKILNN